VENATVLESSKIRVNHLIGDFPCEILTESYLNRATISGQCRRLVSGVPAHSSAAFISDSATTCGAAPCT